MPFEHLIPRPSPESQDSRGRSRRTARRSRLVHKYESACNLRSPGRA